MQVRVSDPAFAAALSAALRLDSYSARQVDAATLDVVALREPPETARQALELRLISWRTRFPWIDVEVVG